MTFLVFSFIYIRRRQWMDSICNEIIETLDLHGLTIVVGHLCFILSWNGSVGKGCIAVYEYVVRYGMNLK